MQTSNQSMVRWAQTCGLLQGNKIMTPPLDGTILPGVTRGSILQLATQLGYEASEEKISVQDALAADEVFTTGTPRRGPQCCSK